MGSPRIRCWQSADLTACKTGWRWPRAMGQGRAVPMDKGVTPAELMARMPRLVKMLMAARTGDKTGGSRKRTADAKGRASPGRALQAEMRPLESIYTIYSAAGSDVAF